MAEETKRVRVTVTDWVGMAKLTGEHHIRFPSNRRLEEFLAAAPAFIAPADAEQGHLSDLLAEVERLRRVENAFSEWLALSDWVQVEFTAGGFKGSAGRHRATIMREEIERLRAERDALLADKARLDYLDRCNAALNAHYGTTYSWRLIQSHNVNRLMLGVSYDVDLDDSQPNGLPSCRDAIDERMRNSGRAAA